MLPAQEIDCSCIPTLLGSICITLIIAEFLHIFFVSSTAYEIFIQKIEKYTYIKFFYRSTSIIQGH
jgi:hypothetical protein